MVLIAKRCPAALLAAGLLTGCGSDDGGGGDSVPAHDAAAPADASLSDAAVVDCQGDHRESQERTNDPLSDETETAEPTGYVLRGAAEPFTVCGQIDPAQASNLLVDGDTYEFTVGGTSPVNVRIELTAPQGQRASDLQIGLYQVDEGTPVFVASGPFRTDYGLIAGVALEPGTYWVNAVAFPPAPEQPVLYSIRLARDSFACPHLDAADYAEAGDGTGRGNDVVAIDHPDPPELTASTMDEAEATGLVLAEESGPVALTGLSAALESDGDSYLDRDTYHLRTGVTTNEVQVRLRWPNGDVDLDVYLFAAGDPASDYSVGLGATVDKVEDELFTVSVDPDRNYWLWVGAYKDGSGLPVNYTATICPRTHAVE